jgi:exopolyphosphatase/guanosine-5'-triphosphate,3'-diphosphate pyrophosphatase
VLAGSVLSEPAPLAFVGDVMRVATLDIGTNTVLLLVADRQADGSLVAVEERATITRLGEGVDRTRTLSPAAIERTRACLADYAGVVRRLGTDRVAVVGTSAMRDAGGGQEVRSQVRALLGVDARVLSGDEEARLTFRGALSGLPVDSREELAVFDIGGGSTEVVLGSLAQQPPRIGFAASFDVGSVRLTERHGEDRVAIERAARDVFAAVPPLPGGGAPPVGIAGTMTTLAAVSLELAQYDGARVHGHVMQRGELAEVVTRLASLDIESRRQLPGMEPKRADVIVAGGCLALALVDHWGASKVRISDRGVRWGLAEEIAAPPP